MDSDRPVDHFLRPDLIWTIQPIQRNSLLRCTLFVGCLFPFIVFGATTRCPLATVRIRRKCFQLFQFSLVTIISAHPNMPLQKKTNRGPHLSLPSKIRSTFFSKRTTRVSTWRDMRGEFMAMCDFVERLSKCWNVPPC